MPEVGIGGVSSNPHWNIGLTPHVFLLAGMNEMFSLPNGASQRLNGDRVKYILLADTNEMFSQPIGASERLNGVRVKYRIANVGKSRPHSLTGLIVKLRSDLGLCSV